MIPVYGFLAGDTLGILIFAYPEDSIEKLAERLQSAAAVRVGPRQAPLRVRYKGQIQPPHKSLRELGLSPLDRFDVVMEGP